METVAEAVARAMRYHQAGDLAHAEQMYREILRVDSSRGEVWFLLGLACQALRRIEEAVTCYQQSISLISTFAEAHNNLGVALEDQGKRSDAIACYQEAIRLKPNYAEAYNNLGSARVFEGQLEEALRCCQQALRLRPAYAKAHNNLGLALAALGRLDEAVASYRQAIQLQPDFTEAHINQGIALCDLGKLDDAVDRFQGALRLVPAHPDAHNNLGIVLSRQGKSDDARAHFMRALSERPEFAEAHNNFGELCLRRDELDEAMARFQVALRFKPRYPAALSNLGNVLSRKGREHDATQYYEKAISLDPKYATAYHNLGLALASRGENDAALASYREALRLKPDYVEALNNLGNAYKDQGKLDEAIDCYRRAIALEPGNATLGSNLLYVLHFHPGYSAQEILTEHQHWARRHAEPFAKAIRPRVIESTRRRLRVGYVSPDFREHVMGFFIEGILSAHDRERFETTCYADVPRPDALTHQIRRHAVHWRSVTGVSDTQAAELIRQDGIDILVDLAGHTGGNRLLVFARKPAPIQATHFGYLATTGLSTIDYRITDSQADPPGMSDRYHTEELIRMPEIAWCYQPASESEISEPPALRLGNISFGSLNSLAKVTPEVIALWSRVLMAVPGSRIVVIAGAGSEGDRRVLDAFVRDGINRERVDLISRKPYSEYLKLYQSIDIHLDSFPFTGCTTTADALWMGVPVITLAGRTCVSRQGVSLLSHLGLHELIAETPDAYVRIGTRLAGDLTKLRDLRIGLRDRMRNSTLTNPQRFTRQLEELYCRMWHRWVTGQQTADSADPKHP